MNQILVIILLVFMFPGYLLAEGITKEQGDAILKELKAIRQELNQIKKTSLVSQGRAKPSRPKTANVSTLGNPILGDFNAPITMVEFTGYQCPFCRKFYLKAYKKLRKHYVDTGKLRFVLRDLPLGFHQHAKPAAISAHCAGEQDKFWEMHDALFDGGKYSAKDILGYAKSIGLDNSSFKTCLTSGRY